ncbi:myeloperoxidase-like [Stegostoma tigrinum]|uniref:myeloperoxidase-like n=1 Tax=Stegostoma tigrinum TaxID=3053191 RepID=UPI00286FCD93|nr:myeloperoxidase-like [Stegostoma tigrinum]
MAETRVAVRSAEYMENALRLIQQHVHRVHKRSLNATDLLTPSDLDVIARVTGCLAVCQPPLCKDDCFTDRYRTFTSVCNNRTMLNPTMFTGDVRVNEHNEQLGVLTFHMVFLRKHNCLARELKKLNPHWSGDTTCQEVRKTLGAFPQIINHRDFASLIIGNGATQKFLPPYEDYNEFINPGVANIVSTAAFRFRHLSIQPKIFCLNENFQEHPQFKIIDLETDQGSKFRSLSLAPSGVDPLMWGLLGKPAKLQKQDKMLPDKLREKLFELTAHLGVDLGALNMQCSRDHGIPGYNAWRRFCSLSAPKDQRELAQVLHNFDLAKKVISLYRTPENIGVWLGAVSEPFVKGGKVGPFLVCLIGQQFKNLRDGNR